MHVEWTAIATHVGIGVGLFYGVIKFFDTVGERLNEDTRLELAVWLLGVKVLPISDTSSFPIKLFRAMCGAPDSRKRLIVSLVLCCVNDILSGLSIGHPYVGMRKFIVETLYFGFTLVLIQVVIAVNEYAVTKGARGRAVLLSVLAVGTSVVVGTGSIVLWLDTTFGRALSSPKLPIVVLRLSIIPALSVSVWMWLPLVAGLMLKAGRRLDIGLAWFNRRFDIEKKPHQAIGLVAGVLVAIFYWTLAMVRAI